LNGCTNSDLTAAAGGEVTTYMHLQEYDLI
jgi:hypothetical protein